MRVFIASDLHFEFHVDRGAALVESLPDADVLVCPGDLAVAPLLGDALALLLLHPEKSLHLCEIARVAVYFPLSNSRRRFRMGIIS